MSSPSGTIDDDRRLPEERSMSKYPDVNIPGMEAWTKAAAKAAPGGDVSKLNWQTPEGLTVKALYTKIGRASCRERVCQYV